METLHALCQRTVVTITGLDINQDATGVTACSCRDGPVLTQLEWKMPAGGAWSVP